MDPLAICTKALAEVVPERLQRPRIGIVCGSGLAGLATSLRDVVQVPYDQLAGFATSTGESTTSARIRLAHGSSVAFRQCRVIGVRWHLGCLDQGMVCPSSPCSDAYALFIVILLTEVHDSVVPSL